MATLSITWTCACDSFSDGQCDCVVASATLTDSGPLLHGGCLLLHMCHMYPEGVEPKNTHLATAGQMCGLWDSPTLCGTIGKSASDTMSL